MALTKVTGQVINDTTGLVVGVTTVGGGLSATDGFFSGIVTAVGDASFSGNVSVGGTLTYEDVTNIDAVGLITARNGVVVGSGITLSKDGDGFFTGVVTATSYAGDGSGLTGIAATDNVRTGILDVAGVGTFRNDVNIADKIIHLGDTNTTIRFPSADTITAETGGSERVRIDSDGRLLMGVTTSQQSDANLQVFKAATTSRITFGNENVSASGIAGIDFCPSNKVQGSRIECQAQEDFSTAANRTADLVFFTRKDGTSSEKLRITNAGEIGLSGTNYGTSGQVITSQGSGSAVQWATPASATSGTYTSFGTGYYVDITTTSTNIVKYDIMFTGVSCGGGTDWQFQLGDSGGVEGSGYEVVACYRSHNTTNQTNNRDNGFRWHGTGSSSFIMDGKFSLTRIHNNKWFGEGQLVRTEGGSTLYDMWGTKELSGALTTIHISASSDDSEVFDGGYYKVIEYTGTV